MNAAPMVRHCQWHQRREALAPICGTCNGTMYHGGEDGYVCGCGNTATYPVYRMVIPTGTCPFLHAI